jgi:hypothetical protein
MENFEFKNGGYRNMQSLFLLLFSLQQQRLSKSNAIANQQIFTPTHHSLRYWPLPKPLEAVKTLHSLTLPE